MQRQGLGATGGIDEDQANPWTVLRIEEKFTCPHFSIRSDTVTHGAGLPRTYNSIRVKSFGVVIAPIDDEGYTTLIGQYRYVLDRFTWEVPGGGCKLDQAPVEGAKVELSEETGYRADHWLRLFDASVSPGSIDECAHFFVAWGLHSGTPHPEPEERLLQRRVPFADAISMALSGEISNLASIALLLGIQTKLVRGELPTDLAMLLQLNLR